MIENKNDWYSTVNFLNTFVLQAKFLNNFLHYIPEKELNEFKNDIINEHWNHPCDRCGKKEYIEEKCNRCKKNKKCERMILCADNIESDRLNGRRNIKKKCLKCGRFVGICCLNVADEMTCVQCF